MFRIIILFFFCLLLGAPVHAAGRSNSVIKDFYFNLGTHTEFYNGIQKDDSGGMRKFDFAPAIGLGLVMPIPSSEYWSFLPEFNWVLPKTYEESNIIVNTFMYRFDMAFDALAWLRLRAGTSLIHLNQHGKGGSTKLRNGNDTSSFYYPSENRSSLNNTFDLGVEAKVDQYAFRFQTYTYSIFKKEQRQLSYTLFFTYYWEKE
ncbi:MAG: hypothetical protein H0V66_01385 [Bdellovibrionales bacterium]|nr:hypothetical protein [Bdellovibrionales bacterium]